jgi:hypothetical protein
MNAASAKRRARSRIATAALVAALATAAAALPAPAGADGTPQRAEYVAKLEGICKPRALATERAMKGARADLSAERLAVAARKFGRASRIFGATVKRIVAVPRPPADAGQLRKWFAYLNRQEAYLKRIVSNLHAGRAVPAQRLTARFIHNGNLANNVVLSFGFEYCSFKFSRYG